MKNEIKESYCSFKVSKLLKEKGFDILPENIQPTDYIYGYIFDEEDEEDFLKVSEFQWEDNIQSHKTLRPTHALAIEWIRINFGIWIEIRHNLITEQFFFEVIKNEGETHHNNRKLLFNLPQEATEAALKHVLNNTVNIFDYEELGTKVIDYANKYANTGKYNDVLEAIQFGYQLSQKINNKYRK